METIAHVRPDAVFAVLGTTRVRGKAAARAGRVETYETVDYGLTHLLLRAALASGARPRFVYLSTAGISEGSRLPYIAVRARMELEVRESGLPFTIARPSFITGPDREEPRPGERVFAGVADAALGLAAALGAKGLAARWRSVMGADLGTALVRLALDPEAAGRDTAGGERDLAASAVALEHRAANVGGDVVGAGGRRWGVLARLGDDRLALGVGGEEEVEAGLEDLFIGGAEPGVGQCMARCGELLQEALRDRQVEATQVGGDEGCDDGTSRRRLDRLQLGGRPMDKTISP